MDCMFCNGQVPITFENDHNVDQITIKGKCKKCDSYFHIRTRRFNIVTNWEY